MTRPIQRAALPLLLVIWTSSLVMAQGPKQAAAPAELRETYFAAIERESAIDEGLALISRLEVDGGVEPALLQAYEGGLITLQAKHGFWPPARLRSLSAGLDLLDAAVAVQPDQVEIRYLRLMSCYYLPGILGRGWSVREDFTALANVLPAAVGAYPPTLYRTMLRFVLEHGSLQDHQATPLRRALAAMDDE